MHFDKYPKSSSNKHISITVLWVLSVYLVMLNTFLNNYAIFIALLLLIFNIRHYAYKNTYRVDINNKMLINEKVIIGIHKFQKEIPLSKYNGIRNRVAWTHGKHCQTELIDSIGGYLPIRVELNNHKISKEAEEFKKQFSEFTGIRESMDLPHA